MKDLDAALHHGKEAAKLTKKGHPDRAGCLEHLAQCYRHYYIQFREPRYLEAVHTHYLEFFESPTLTPEDVWATALDWASFAEEFQPSDCVTAYTAAFNLLPDLLWIGNSIPVRHEAIRRLEIGHKTSIAAKTCIDLSDLTTAVEIMEQGLATIFQQMLQLKTDANQLQPAQAESLRMISTQLYSGNSENQRGFAIERKDLLKEIHEQPGLEYFLLPKPYEVLRHASQGGPIVILNSHEDSCDGIIILDPTSSPIHVSLPNTTLEILQSQRAILKELLGRCNEYFTSKPPEECFADLLAWLWTEIVSPVYQVLDSHGIHNGRLWWLPTGAFAGLPLHAASGTDQFIHSYTATLGSLLDAYTKKSSGTSKFGIVGVTHTGPHGTDYLKGVEEEVARISSIIKGPINFLDGKQATVDAVKVQLQDCSWVHLACHGKQESGDPTKSYLKLYGGILELDTILRMPLLNAEFVFLAACQTAMGDAELVNESFHLSGGFIAAGFRSSIGTLWAMNDQDGPLVADIVYSYLFRDSSPPQAKDSAEALHIAIKELKARKVPYERWIPFIHMGV
ncbi:CHAT domain-containing protein [Mycena rosella]|uniref:CHAT domain-containing protein n=1 Tax=Mycena rosella TaxID=1033263 RepID=A0AAD7CPH5_MYCRO|nr:CHAT domain-containing protein [Mycena rosella]